MTLCRKTSNGVSLLWRAGNPRISCHGFDRTSKGVKRLSASRNAARDPDVHRDSYNSLLCGSGTVHPAGSSSPSCDVQFGIARSRYSWNIGTVKAVSPCAGLQTIPLRIRPVRMGAAVVTGTPRVAAMSPDRCGPAPSSAIARRYSCSRADSGALAHIPLDRLVRVRSWMRAFWMPPFPLCVGIPAWQR